MFLWPAQRSFCSFKFLWPQGRTVRFAASLLAGCAEANFCLYTNERWPVCILFSFFNCPVNGGNIVSVFYLLDMPAVRLEAKLNIFRKGKCCGTSQRYFVIIIKDN